MKRVLISGVTGYLGSELARQCLNANYTVTGTVRSLSNQKKLSVLDQLPQRQNLKLVEADLRSPSDVWVEAAESCDYILHSASPVSDEDFLDTPLIGMQSILEAAKVHKVKRTVFTSTVNTLMALKPNNGVYTEQDEGDPQIGMKYGRGKIIAENWAWQFCKQNELSLSVILPGLIFGEGLQQTSSGEILLAFLGQNRVVNIFCPLIDLQDCALSHLKALESPIAHGQRYICVAKSLWFLEIMKFLNQQFQKYGYKFPKKPFPHFESFSKLAKVLNEDLALVLQLANKEFHYSSEKMQKELNMEFKPVEESILGSFYQLITTGKV